MKTILVTFFILIASCAFANPVDVKTASLVAENYYNSNANVKVNALSLTYQEITSTGDTAIFYVFNINQSDGWIIVAATDASYPVLGYSPSGNYSKQDQPPAFIYWMEGYKNQILDIIRRRIPPTTEINAEWTTYKSLKGGSSNKSPLTVGPLLSTTWNQGQYYNAWCPGGCPTGCVATAMAQIMKYWNYPAIGTGDHCYQHPAYGQLCANFGNTTYNWSAMPNNVTYSNTAVATLMYHCGVSVNMDYCQNGSNASGAWVLTNDHLGYHSNSAQNAYSTYFGYSPNTLQGLMRSGYSDSYWINNILKPELDAAKPRPIQYAAWENNGQSAHTWVCDGYNSNNQFWMNWGWGPNGNNGWFTVNNLTPGSNNFDENHQVLIGIRPNKADLIPVSQSLNSSSIQAGSNATAYCAEDNQGTLSASANVVSIHLSSNNVLTPGSNGDTWIGEISIPNVAANSCSNVYSGTIQIPAGTSVGNYYVFFSADGGEAVTEYNELNNFVSVQITVNGGSGGALPNDDCGNSATMLTSGTTCNYTPGTVAGATSSGLTIPNCNGYQSPTALDVWFQFDAVCPEHTITVDPEGNTTGNNNYLDSDIALYSNCSNAGFIECFDQSGGGGVTTTYTFSGLTPGATYYIRVFDYGTSQPIYPGFNICVTHSCGGSGNVNLVFSQYEIDDDASGGSNGDNDGLCEPGEDIELDVELYNSGTQDANNVEGFLTTSDPDITITDNQQLWGTIAAGDYDWTSDFDFTISADCPEKDVTFILSIISDEGSWTESFTIHIYGTGGSGSVALEISQYEIDDDASGGSNGDNDGLCEPGEDIELDVELYNSGTLDANNVEGFLTTSDLNITITDTQQSWGTIAAGDYGWTSDFDFTISSDCPEKDVTFTLNITSDEGSWTETFVIHIYGSALTSCLDCPSFDFDLASNTNWQNHSSSIMQGACKMYRFLTQNGVAYTWKTGCGDGATAAFDSELVLLDPSCNIIASNDDGCSDFQSKIEWTSDLPDNTYVFLKVKSYDESSGGYVLAYNEASPMVYYTVTTSSNPAEAGTTSGGGTFPSGSNITVSAFPSYENIFENWTENGTVVSTNINYSFTVTANRTLVANFTVTSQNATKPTFAKLYDDSNDLNAFNGVIDFAQSTIDSSYIVGGQYSYTGSSNDGFYFYKVDKNGNLIWSKEITDFNAVIHSIVKSVNGYMISFGINNEAAIMEVSEGGNVLWSKKLDHYIQNFTSTQGGYIGTYSFMNTINLVKLDFEGNLLWSRIFNYDNPNGEYVYCEKLASDYYGNIYLLGGIQNPNFFSSQNGIIQKVSPDGNPIWCKQISTFDNYADHLTGFVIDNYSNLYFGLLTNDNYGELSNGYIGKLNSSGALSSLKQLPVSVSPELFSISQTGDVVQAWYGSDFQTTILYLNPSLDIIDLKTFEYQGLWIAKSTLDHNIMFGGFETIYRLNGQTDLHFNMFKVSMNHNSCIDAQQQTMALTNTSVNVNSIAVSTTNSGITLSDFYVNPVNATLLDSTLCDDSGIFTSTNEIISVVVEENKFSIFPNPTSGQFTLEAADLKGDLYRLEIIDGTGRTDKRLTINTVDGQISQTIDVDDLPDGIYMLRISSSGYNQSLKLIIR